MWPSRLIRYKILYAGDRSDQAVRSNNDIREKVNECLPSTKVERNMGRNVAAGPAQDGERVKSGPPVWHCGCHILIYPQFGRSSIQGRPTIIPCLSETEARAQKGTIGGKEKHSSASRDRWPEWSSFSADWLSPKLKRGSIPRLSHDFDFDRMPRLHGRVGQSVRERVTCLELSQTKVEQPLTCKGG
ncbi:hypothetical protein IQ06DRAFT_39581 [Phaeosphaeriaceae sp. SRC1lsM3a]|nr:hypothetical protein IQ06DRAFT_39581 [Stagonospora sp. SRC1lsM3a]